MAATKAEHQQVMTEMLAEIDRICQKHGIRYILFAGTALGAVRHQGFIPWDDDLDVMMLRPEYDKFLKVAEQELDPRIFFLQKEFSRHWPMFFSKLRKNGTACMERYIPKDDQIHQGVYIDIFPGDNLSEIPAVRSLQFLASKVVIAKGLYRRGYLTASWEKRVFMGLCCLLPGKALWKLAALPGKPDSPMVHGFFGGASQYWKAVFPREWMAETALLPFAGRNYPVSAHCHALLTRLYGDYLRIPPEEERGCKVHAELVDLEHSYEEYVGIQKTMTFREYTRSIR